MDKELIECKPYQIIDPYNEKKYIYKLLLNTLKQNITIS